MKRWRDQYAFKLRDVIICAEQSFYSLRVGLWLEYRYYIKAMYMIQSPICPNAARLVKERSH
ncbi:uncharacterized protein BBA_07223 [Beauveria bassiana ARSEF 2860]|uniref:Uncharacterized protein n=1 Tax=Beauveria bassiana (strain ARSEF 2860) TaxID=655819 RepID=J4KMG2_BEAB2|nr:uncharacterized protein BBA_07223 [Beauveria bassiana ARSEF 2860]EJP63899.1 hypothetical protein BBA_07223 [Beauveria bassiana ARSEF 2860]